MTQSQRQYGIPLCVYILGMWITCSLIRFMFLHQRWGYLPIILLVTAIVFYALRRMRPMPLPVDPYTYWIKPKQLRAVIWTGSNLAEVHEVYPGVGEEYLRSRGIRPGDYILCPWPGRLDAMSPDTFNECYTRTPDPRSN